MSTDRPVFWCEKCETPTVSPDGAVLCCAACEHKRMVRVPKR